jgi:drug/metabolite transporter (DMT)-like permease
MSSHRPAFPPVLVLVLGILGISTASIFIRYAQQDAPSLVIAAWRLILASLILTPLALSRRRAELAALSRVEVGLAALSGFFLAIHFATWISSLAYTSVASSVVLVNTMPLWVALMTPLLLRETVSRPVWWGMLLALAGGVLVAVSDTCAWTGSGLACPSLAEFTRGRAFWGDILALIGAIAAAVYLIIGRRVRARVSLLSYVFIVYSISAVFLVIFMLAAGYSPFGYSPMTYVWCLLLALIPQLIGHSSYNWALAYLSAAYVSIALLGEPIGSSILAYVLLEEMPTLPKLTGAALILVGIYLASRSEAGGQPAQVERSTA